MPTPWEVALAKTIEAREALAQALAVVRTIGTSIEADEARLALSLASTYAITAEGRLDRRVKADARARGPLREPKDRAARPQGDQGRETPDQPRELPPAGGGDPDPSR